MSNNQISWGKLRSWNGSVNRAFELLCSQLAYHELIHDRKSFVSTGLRDAGVECYWVLNNGNEIGWQAKYFLQTMHEPELLQLDKSVKTAIKKHPKLTEYIICIPHDLDDPRMENKESETERWNKRVDKWKEWAKKEGLDISFTIWGEHAIIERLSKSENSGRRYFWFNETEFSEDWFNQHITSQIAKASHRYSPNLHIDIPLKENIGFFLREDNFYSEFKTYRIKLIDKGKYLFKNLAKLSIDQNLVNEAKQKFTHIISSIEMIKSFSFEIFDFKLLSTEVYNLKLALENISLAIENLTLEKDNSVKRELRELENALGDTFYFLTGVETVLANSKCLTIKGFGGAGKTHLLCDLCKERNENGQPTLLFFGDEFNNSDSWSQIINRLQIDCKRDELLESLNTIAFLKNSYGIIVIDALNEGDGKRIWKSELLSFLEILKNYPSLKVIISIRSDYFSAIIDYDSLKKDSALLEHVGFQKVEFQATKSFFDFYGIERPKIPLLVPEFSNPLFLKLFCEAISKGKLNVEDMNESGVSTIYSAFIDGVNEKLSSFDQLDYDKADNKVRRAVYDLSNFKFSSQKRAVSRFEASRILNQILDTQGHDNSLLNRLLSEGVLKETILFDQQTDDWDDAVDFAYERLSDYLLAEYIVEDYLSLNIRNTEQNFYQWLGNRADFNEWDSGVLEALSIIVPEKLGSELINLVPKKDIYFMSSPFIKSLIWRNPNYITEETINSINNYLLKNIDQYTVFEFFDALLLISANPKHKLNAERLHQYLNRFDLPKRESIWQNYLKTNYYEEGVINRVLDWSLSKHDKSNIKDESIFLYGIVLCWFFTSTNRELRDKATKGFTILFLKRPHLLPKFLEEFSACDDPYLTERLYASILGICQLSNKRGDVIQIATNVYSSFFKNGTPTTNIQIRDYARGIVEASERFEILSESKKEKITPPYSSNWPEYIPRVKDLKKSDPFDKTKKNYTPEERGLGRIFHSVLSDDFARYIIGTNSGFFNWSPIRIDDKNKAEKDIALNFCATLTEKQSNIFFDLFDLQIATKNINWSNQTESFEFEGKVYTGKQLLRKRDSTENRFLRSLGKKKRLHFEEFTKKYISNVGYRDTGFNLKLAQRWILNRVFELGWDESLHGEFDSSFSSYGRTEHRQERIGKKYQWIAYFEFLGLVSDNFVFDPLLSDSNNYLGTWQIAVRDIDPSMINLTNKSDKYYPDKNWWNDLKYDNWLNPSDWKKWLKKTDDIPDPKKLIIAKNPKDDSEWYCFHNGGRWKNVLKEEEYSSEYQEIWYSVKPYFIARHDIGTIQEELKKEASFEFPRISRLEEMYYGEHYYSTAFKEIYRKHRPSDWISTTETFENKNIPTPLMLPFSNYYKGESQDHSLSQGINIYIPIETLANDLRLSINEKIGYFFDDSGELIAYNPHLFEEGEPVCLFNKKVLNQYLQKKDWTILWKVYGEKIEQKSVRNDDYYGRLIIKGHYYLDKKFELQGYMYPLFDKS